MPSSPYFSVHPYGIGTASVECLSSVLHRLSVAHGVTRHQFVSHLRHWWNAHRGKHLPRCEELRWDGYSPNVTLAVEALQEATGLDLAGCTLVALKGTCAGNCIGAIKQIRWWCPACFRDDLANEREPYDRLVWRIQGIDRCSTHRHRLASCCPICGSVQANDKSRTELHHCASCGGELLISDGRSSHLARPAFGEAQIERLVANLSSLRITAELPLKRFFASLGVDRSQVEEELGDLIHTRCIMSKPSLTSLIAVSVCYDVDTLQLISAPEEAAQQTSLDFKRVIPRRRTRPFPRLSAARSAWFERELIAALKAGPPYPSVPTFCRSREFSCSAARHRFSALIRQLSRKHLEWKRRNARQLQLCAERCYRALGRKRTSLTEREMVRLIAEESKAPVHVVRAVVRSGETMRTSYAPLKRTDR